MSSGLLRAYEILVGKCKAESSVYLTFDQARVALQMGGDMAWPDGTTMEDIYGNLENAGLIRTLRPAMLEERVIIPLKRM